MKLKLLATAVACLQIGAAALPAAQALADPGDHGRGWEKHDHGDHDRGDWGGRGDRDNRHYDRDDRRGWDRREDRREGYREAYRPERFDRDRDWRGPGYYAPPGRVRHYNDIVIARPYGHWYDGYGRHRHDDDAFRWLAFAAITMGILNVLSESQQRSLEDAQIRATDARIGDPVHWSNGNAYGNVVATSEGRDSSGRYCREFQQEVRVAGKKDQAYGTACLREDGSWEIVSTR